MENGAYLQPKSIYRNEILKAVISCYRLEYKLTGGSFGQRSLPYQLQFYNARCLKGVFWIHPLLPNLFPGRPGAPQAQLPTLKQCGNWLRTSRSVSSPSHCSGTQLMYGFCAACLCLVTAHAQPTARQLPLPPLLTFVALLKKVRAAHAWLLPSFCCAPNSILEPVENFEWVAIVKSYCFQYKSLNFQPLFLEFSIFVLM